MKFDEWQKQQLQQRTQRQVKKYVEGQLVGKPIDEVDQEMLAKGVEGIIEANVDFFVEGRKELGQPKKRRR